MESVKTNQTLDSTNTFFDYSFETLDLNKDMEKLYEIINDDETLDEFEQKIRLSKLRNKNYERYYSLDISNFEDLPNDFEDIIKDIMDLYGYIDSSKILNGNASESKNIKQLLDNIYRRKDRLDRMVNSYLKEITKNNNEKQSKFSLIYFNNLFIKIIKFL